MNNEPIWRLQMWGDLCLRDRHGTVVAIPGENCQMLLVYLAINQGIAVRRADVAVDLWPDAKTRRTILRGVIKDLREVIEPKGSLLDGKIIEQPKTEWLQLSSLVECDHALLRKRISQWKRAFGEQRIALAHQIREVTDGKTFVPLLKMDWIDEEQEKWEDDLTRIAKESPARPKQETVSEQQASPPTRRRLIGFPPQCFCIGRDKEIDALMQWWSDPTMRVACLYGMGGMGKTTLAGEFCRLLNAAVPNLGYAYVALQNKTTIHEMAIAVAEACHKDTRVAQSERGERELVGRAVADYSPIVVVLDAVESYLNREVESEFWQLIARMVAEHPGVKVLCTSRKALPFPECFTVEVAPFKLPQAAASRFRYRGSPNDAHHPAAELYRRTRLALNAAPGKVSEIMSLCLLLEGVPLAIRISAQIRSLGPREAAQKFQRKMALPKNLGGDRRHASLQAILGVAWGALSPAAQTLAQMLSGFAGNWTREAFLFVSNAEHGDMEEAMEELLAASWVSQEPAVESLLEGTSGSAFSMLHVVREFILETVSQVEPRRRESWQRAHADFYHGCAAQAFKNYLEKPWLIWMHRESANCTVALATFEAFGETDASSVLRAMEFCRTTNPLFLLQGNFKEGMERCRRVIALARKYGEVENDPFMARCADLLHAEAIFWYNLADFSTSWSRFEEAQALRCELGLVGSQVYTITEDLKVNIMNECCDPKVLRSLVVQINQEILKRESNPALQGLLPDAWLNLGRCWMALKEYEQAYQAFVQSGEVFVRFCQPESVVLRGAILCGIIASAIETSRSTVACRAVIDCAALFKRDPAEAEAVDNRLLLSLSEHAACLCIHLREGRRAAELYQVAQQWREEMGKGYSRRAREAHDEILSEIVALIGEAGLAEAQETTQGYGVVEVLGLLSWFTAAEA